MQNLSDYVWSLRFFVEKLFPGKYLTSFTKTSDYVIIFLQGRPCKGRCPEMVAVILLGCVF